MTFNKNLLAATLITAGGFAAISSANADTTTSELTVSTIIEDSCTVDATNANISFTGIAAGTSDATIAKKASTAGISVKCSLDSPYVINLTAAGNNTSTTGEGKMVGTGTNDKFLTYQLYSDADGTTVWGNTGVLGTTGNGVAGIGKGVDSENLHSVYATITSTTDVRQDTYSDKITASVVY